MKILVCEDDIMVAKAIEHRLTQESYQIEIAQDGRSAAEKIKNQTYDLIITDMMMPFMSGLELINLLRNQLKRTTPLIVLSKLDNEDSIIEAFNLGADDYIKKPFSPNELNIRVKRLLLKK